MIAPAGAGTTWYATAPPDITRASIQRHDVSPFSLTVDLQRRAHFRGAACIAFAASAFNSDFGIRSTTGISS
jgi:hypothetical protein